MWRSKEHLNYALELYQQGNTNKSDIARQIKDKFNLPDTVNAIRKRIERPIFRFESRGLNDECEQVGIPVDKVNHYWYKGKNYSIHVKGKDIVSYEEMRDEIVESMREHPPD